MSQFSTQIQGPQSAIVPQVEPTYQENIPQRGPEQFGFSQGVDWSKIGQAAAQLGSNLYEGYQQSAWDEKERKIKDAQSELNRKLEQASVTEDWNATKTAHDEFEKTASGVLGYNLNDPYSGGTYQMRLQAMAKNVALDVESKIAAGQARTVEEDKKFLLDHQLKRISSDAQTSAIMGDYDVARANNLKMAQVFKAVHGVELADALKSENANLRRQAQAVSYASEDMLATIDQTETKGDLDARQQSIRQLESDFKIQVSTAAKEKDFETVAALTQSYLAAVSSELDRVPGIIKTKDGSYTLTEENARTLSKVERMNAYKLLTMLHVPDPYMAGARAQAQTKATDESRGLLANSTTFLQNASKKTKDAQEAQQLVIDDLVKRQVNLETPEGQTQVKAANDLLSAAVSDRNRALDQLTMSLIRHARTLGASEEDISDRRVGLDAENDESVWYSTPSREKMIKYISDHDTTESGHTRLNELTAAIASLDVDLSDSTKKMLDMHKSISDAQRERWTSGIALDFATFERQIKSIQADPALDSDEKDRQLEAASKAFDSTLSNRFKSFIDPKVANDVNFDFAAGLALDPDKIRGTDMPLIVSQLFDKALVKRQEVLTASISSSGTRMARDTSGADAVHAYLTGSSATGKSVAVSADELRKGAVALFGKNGIKSEGDLVQAITSPDANPVMAVHPGLMVQAFPGLLVTLATPADNTDEGTRNKESLKTGLTRPGFAQFQYQADGTTQVEMSASPDLVTAHRNVAVSTSKIDMEGFAIGFLSQPPQIRVDILAKLRSDPNYTGGENNQLFKTRVDELSYINDRFRGEGDVRKFLQESQTSPAIMTRIVDMNSALAYDDKKKQAEQDPTRTLPKNATPSLEEQTMIQIGVLRGKIIGDIRFSTPEKGSTVSITEDNLQAAGYATVRRTINRALVDSVSDLAVSLKVTPDVIMSDYGTYKDRLLFATQTRLSRWNLSKIVDSTGKNAQGMLQDKPIEQVPAIPSSPSRVLYRAIPTELRMPGMLEEASMVSETTNGGDTPTTSSSQWMSPSTLAIKTGGNSTWGDAFKEDPALVAVNAQATISCPTVRGGAEKDKNYSSAELIQQGLGGRKDNATILATIAVYNSQDFTRRRPTMAQFKNDVEIARNSILEFVKDPKKTPANPNYSFRWVSDVDFSNPQAARSTLQVVVNTPGHVLHGRPVGRFQPSYGSGEVNQTLSDKISFAGRSSDWLKDRLGNPDENANIHVAVHGASSLDESSVEAGKTNNKTTVGISTEDQVVMKWFRDNPTETSFEYLSGRSESGRNTTKNYAVYSKVVGDDGSVALRKRFRSEASDFDESSGLISDSVIVEKADARPLLRVTGPKRTAVETTAVAPEAQLPYIDYVSSPRNPIPFERIPSHIASFVDGLPELVKHVAGHLQEKITPKAELALSTLRSEYNKRLPPVLRISNEELVKMIAVSGFNSSATKMKPILDNPKAVKPGPGSKPVPMGGPDNYQNTTPNDMVWTGVPYLVYPSVEQVQRDMQEFALREKQIADYNNIPRDMSDLDWMLMQMRSGIFGGPTPLTPDDYARNMARGSYLDRLSKTR